jgi:hypothetical protein
MGRVGLVRYIDDRDISEFNLPSTIFVDYFDLEPVWTDYQPLRDFLDAPL